MLPWLIAGGVLLFLLLVWIVLEARTARPDGYYIKQTHPYRVLMAYIMRTRNESYVLFDATVKAEKLLEYTEQSKEQFGADISHCTVAACARGQAENPTMNNFVSGRRLYRRKGIHLSFSMKRKAMNKKAKIAVVKKRIKPGENFREFCERVNASINVQRSDKVTSHDKEYKLFNMVPRPGLMAFVVLFKALDHYGLLPGFFVLPDGMFTSMFVANLGSLKMGAGYHHLYEWGNCPLFLMVGQVEERAVVEDGQVVVRKILPLRFTYDERIDDGLSARFGIETIVRTLEDPYKYLGCLDGDDSERLPLCTQEQSMEGPPQ